MANETFLTIVGTIVADPETRFTPSGAGVTNFRVAVNARKFDKQTNEFKKQPPNFWACNAWNQGSMKLAENVAEQLKKGDGVVVYGELVTREYETKEGEKRSVDEIRVEAIGKDLKWHSGGGQQSRPASNAGNGFGNSAPATDPWGAPASNPSGGWGNPGQDQPPF